MIRRLALAGALALSGGTASAQMVRINKNPFPSTYQPMPSRTTLIRGAHVFDGLGGMMDKADVLMQDGKIAAVGENLDAPDGAVIVDGSGKWVTPGIIDPHSHLGVYASPGVRATSDGVPVAVTEIKLLPWLIWTPDGACAREGGCRNGGAPVSGF